MEVVQDYEEIRIENSGIVKAFVQMFMGLLLTAAISYFTYKKGLYLELPYVFLAILELVVVLVFNLLYKKLSPALVKVLFYTYAGINGLTMGTIFPAYGINTVSNAFFMTALLFGGLALIGYTTKKDLTNVGTILTVGLLIALIVSIINIFIGNTFIDIVLDWIILGIFCGLTIKDINSFKSIANEVNCDNEKLYVYFAMSLYLDFINIFIRLLSIMSRNSKRK